MAKPENRVMSVCSPDFFAKNMTNKETGESPLGPASEQVAPPDTALPNLLKELLGKSWNLELLISGAAIVFAGFLPDWVERSYYLQQQYVALDGGGPFATLPLLAYAFFKVVAWLLIASFVVHLVMRAFWVGLIGLQAAYPEGIRYDHIPNVAPATRRFQEKKLGRLDDFILRLDRLCSQVLALAFLIALMGVAIGLAYNMVFWTMQAVQVFLPEKWLMILWNLIAFVFLSGAVAIVWFNFKMKKGGDLNEKYGLRMARLGWGFNTMAIPLLARPIMYLSLVFLSNVPPRRYYWTLAGLGVVVMVSVFTILTQKIGEIKQRNLLEIRGWYSAGDPARLLQSDAYDNLRSPSSGHIPPLSIQADVVEGPFLRVFVAYPKTLDAAIGRYCTEPALPDSIGKRERVRLVDSLSLACLSSFFQLSINDSLYREPGWVFHEKDGLVSAKGLLAYLPTASFLLGKNVVEIKTHSAQKPDSLNNYASLPFWFAPK